MSGPARRAPHGRTRVVNRPVSRRGRPMIRPSAWHFAGVWLAAIVTFAAGLRWLTTD